MGGRRKAERGCQGSGANGAGIAERSWAVRDAHVAPQRVASPVSGATTQDVKAACCYGGRDVKFDAVLLRWSSSEIWRRVATVVGM